MSLLRAHIQSEPVVEVAQTSCSSEPATRLASVLSVHHIPQVGFLHL